MRREKSHASTSSATANTNAGPISATRPQKSDLYSSTPESVSRACSSSGDDLISFSIFSSWSALGRSVRAV